MMLPWGGLVEVDAEIAPIVKALNDCGVTTRASCSGHGVRPASIALLDGREIIIARDWSEGRKIFAALQPPAPSLKDEDNGD